MKTARKIDRFSGVPRRNGVLPNQRIRNSRVHDGCRRVSILLRMQR